MAGSTTGAFEKAGGAREGFGKDLNHHEQGSKELEGGRGLGFSLRFVRFVASNYEDKSTCVHACSHFGEEGDR